MEYTIQKLSQIAKISTRTLRYYDEIGLLKPKRISSSGYRIYGQQQVDQLQQILFYRELGVKLKTIKSILDDPHFNEMDALKDHYQHMIKERNRLNQLITTLEKTMESKERGVTMADHDKFVGFKQSLVDENEKKFGKEIREKYGEETVERSNQQMLNMTEEQYTEFVALTEQVQQQLRIAFETKDVQSEEAKLLVDLHIKWLSFTWPSYSTEAHRGLADMYVADERFAEYYNQGETGLAEFLRDAIHTHAQ